MRRPTPAYAEQVSRGASRLLDAVVSEQATLAVVGTHGLGPSKLESALARALRP